MPEHKLSLKVGVPIILLRNINPKGGLCNGTRLQITHLGQWIIGAQILTGSFKGRRVMIPRITLTNNGESDMTCELRRRQFPIRLAFAITINKSQGQSLKYVGVDLRNEVFAHGQLYVAVSRATEPANVKVLTGNGRETAKNVVYQDVLT